MINVLIAIGTVVTALATIGLCVLAWIGLDKWKAEIEHNRKREIADELIHAIENYRLIFDEARDRQFYDRVSDDEISYYSNDIKDIEAFASMYHPLRTIKKADIFLEKIQDLCVSAEVYFNKDIKPHVKTLKSYRYRYEKAADKLIRLYFGKEKDDDNGRNAEIDRLIGIVFYGSGPNEEFEAQLTSIQAIYSALGDLAPQARVDQLPIKSTNNINL